MRRYSFIFILFLTGVTFSQVANYNQFPTMQQYKMLDTKLDSISFAFSMRQVNTSYTGPIIKLRRASDNAEMDFSKGFNDIVDIDSIDSWRAGSNVYVKTWFDQSGLGRDAVQPTNNFQPQFIPDSAKPYLQGDGTNDRLDVLTSIQTLTNSGVNGLVIGVLYSTSKSQHSFGTLVGSNRWSTHINWNNGNVYFDPGFCCNGTRSFVNPINTWGQYTFVRTTTHVLARLDGVQKMNGLHTTGPCTVVNDFGIAYANGGGGYSTTRFTELIMYKYDIHLAKYIEMELDMKSFWGL